jgi:hypothetical protein
MFAGANERLGLVEPAALAAGIRVTLASRYVLGVLRRGDVPSHIEPEFLAALRPAVPVGTVVPTLGPAGRPNEVVGIGADGAEIRHGALSGCG